MPLGLHSSSDPKEAKLWLWGCGCNDSKLSPLLWVPSRGKSLEAFLLVCLFFLFPPNLKAFINM